MKKREGGTPFFPRKGSLPSRSSPPPQRTFKIFRLYPSPFASIPPPLDSSSTPSPRTLRPGATSAETRASRRFRRFPCPPLFLADPAPADRDPSLRPTPSIPRRTTAARPQTGPGYIPGGGMQGARTPLAGCLGRSPTRSRPAWPPYRPGFANEACLGSNSGCRSASIVPREDQAKFAFAKAKAYHEARWSACPICARAGAARKSLYTVKNLNRGDIWLCGSTAKRLIQDLKGRDRLIDCAAHEYPRRELVEAPRSASSWSGCAPAMRSSSGRPTPLEQRDYE
jgi:hypothetical protein